MTLRATKELLERHYTADEFKDLPEFNDRYELIHGKLVEKAMPKPDHSRAVKRLMSAYEKFDPEEEIGEMLPETTFRLTDDYTSVPDLAFWSKGREPKPGADYAPTPDLAIEVQSRGQSLAELTQKVKDYLTGGVRLAWIVQTDQQQVRIFHPNQPQANILTVGDTLDGEDVIPGFKVAIADLLK